MTELTQMKCVACRADEPKVTDAEIAMYKPQIPDWQIVEREGIKQLERTFKFKDFASRRFHQQGGTNSGSRGTSSDNYDGVGQGDRDELGTIRTPLRVICDISPSFSPTIVLR